MHFGSLVIEKCNAWLLSLFMTCCCSWFLVVTAKPTHCSLSQFHWRCLQTPVNQKLSGHLTCIMGWKCASVYLRDQFAQVSYDRSIYVLSEEMGSGTNLVIRGILCFHVNYVTDNMVNIYIQENGSDPFYQVEDMIYLVVCILCVWLSGVASSPSPALQMAFPIFLIAFTFMFWDTDNQKILLCLKN